MILTPDLEETLVRCYNSTEVFCKTIYPEVFDLPNSSHIHRKIYDVLDDPTERRVLIVAPRGIGKSSIIQLGFPSKQILFRESRFIVPISYSAAHSVSRSENLKRHLTQDALIKSLFGDMRSDVFSKEMWVAEVDDGDGNKYRCGILPRGVGQQVRGLLFDDDRPDLILVDDIEHPENMPSEDQRKKYWEWFHADVCNSIDRGKKNWRIIVIGTLLHQDSLIAKLMDDPEWTTVHLEICDDSYKSLWPEFISDEEIEKMVEGHRRRGTLHIFYKEYRNICQADETATFKEEYFHPYSEIERMPSKDPNVENVVLVDPAKTVEVHSAETGIVGVGYNGVSNEWLVRDVVAAKLHPDEIYEEAINMCERIDAKILGIEVTSLNEFVTYPFRNELLRRGLGHIEFIELKARGKKEERVKALIPFYRQGLVKHNIACCGPLEAQLMGFPRSRRWDLMDALAYMVELLEKGERYFHTREYSEKKEVVEAEYKELYSTYDRRPPRMWRRSP